MYLYWKQVWSYQNTHVCKSYFLLNFRIFTQARTTSGLCSSMVLVRGFWWFHEGMPSYYHSSISINKYLRRRQKKRDARMGQRSLTQPLHARKLCSHQRGTRTWIYGKIWSCFIVPINHLVLPYKKEHIGVVYVNPGVIKYTCLIKRYCEEIGHNRACRCVRLPRHCKYWHRVEVLSKR